MVAVVVVCLFTPRVGGRVVSHLLKEGRAASRMRLTDSTTRSCARTERNGTGRDGCAKISGGERPGGVRGTARGTDAARQSV